MKKIAFITIIIFVILAWFLIFRFAPQGREAKNASSLPNPVSPPNAPKTYIFDSSNDLKKELDSVQPQVLDSDFE